MAWWRRCARTLCATATGWTAAAELFAERGVDVPLDEIARRAGVSIGTLYNHFPNRGALLDAVLPERLAEVDRLAEAALADPDPWQGFAGFLDGLFVMQARDRSMNEAIARSPVGSVDVAAECGRAGGVLDAVVDGPGMPACCARTSAPTIWPPWCGRCRR